MINIGNVLRHVHGCYGYSRVVAGSSKGFILAVL